MNHHNDRVVLLVDMDCFYCQVEENLDPALIGKPVAVVQYNAWKGGGIIAVNYPARDRGVTRHMRGDQAKSQCPEINLVTVPNIRGKADLTKYREAGKRVAEVLQTFTPLLERASVDEAYLDITAEVNKRLEREIKILDPSLLKNTHIVGYDNVDKFLSSIYECKEDNLKLAFGAIIAEEVRAAVFEQTGYKCSAGIAHNKILAKLVAGLNKPNKQTVLPQDTVPTLYENLPIRKIKSLGGKFGNELSDLLGIKNMGQLFKFSVKDLSKHFDEKNATWLYNIARGIDLEPVTIRLVSKSIGCCKNFPGRTALKTDKSVTHWLNELSIEIAERLEKDLEENNRKAKQMVVSFLQEINKKDVSGSRTHPLNSYEAPKIMAGAFEVIKKNCMRPNGTFHIKNMGISVGKFEDVKSGSRDITAFFKNIDKSQTISRAKIEEKGELNELQSKSSKKGSIMSFLNLNQRAIASKSKTEQNELADNSGNSRENLKLFNDSSTSDLDKKFSLDQNDSKDGENAGSDSDDSISQELTAKDDNAPSSFFKQYLEELQATPADRNFDTSIILDEVDESGQNIDEILDQEIEQSQMNITLKALESAEQECQTSTESKSPNLNMDYTKMKYEKTCPECNKNVPVYEYTSHMDYHFAMNLVREEADLYKPTSSNQSNNKQNEIKKVVKKGHKRKSDDCSNLKMTSFLVAKTDDNVPTKLCDECNRRFPLSELEVHFDYHAAKKLHLELNPTNAVVRHNGSNVGKNNGEKIKKVKGIESFFKEV